MQSGWVIVYVPGGDIYQLLDTGPSAELVQTSLKKRILKGGIKTFLTCAQLYWWFKS